MDYFIQMCLYMVLFYLHYKSCYFSVCTILPVHCLVWCRLLWWSTLTYTDKGVEDQALLSATWMDSQQVPPVTLALDCGNWPSVWATGSERVMRSESLPGQVKHLTKQHWNQSIPQRVLNQNCILKGKKPSQLWSYFGFIIWWLLKVIF